MNDKKNNIFEECTPIFNQYIKDDEIKERFKKLYRRAQVHLNKSSQRRLKTIRADQDKELMHYLQGLEVSFDSSVKHRLEQTEKNFNGIADKHSVSPKLLLELGAECALRQTKAAFEKDIRGTLEEHYGQALSYVDFAITSQMSPQRPAKSKEPGLSL